jgi:YgiT-type zinc finger domain-containing protein
MMFCSVCNDKMVPGGLATQVYRHGNAVVTVTGIPAVATCSHCGNAILDWHIAQQVEDLIQPLLHRPDTHTLPDPVVSITFPAMLPTAA